ncbi:MAG: endonuclease [Candidatus Neomarinimicrobiota bacterium]
MQFMDWNIEWMNKWFVGGGQVAWRQSHSGIANVADLAQRVANVITAIDPDVLTLQEGPSDPNEMGLFINDFLLGSNGQPLFDQLGGIDGSAQKIYTLIKRGGLFQNARLASDNTTNNLFVEWMADIDGNAVLEPYSYTRNPLVVDGELSGTGETIRILTLHTKSKYVHQQQSMWNNPNRRQEFIIAALENRRRISTEAMHTREYLDGLYNTNPATLIVVTGDFNDGPGFDYFEKNYLTHSVADILIGSSYRPDHQFEHALVGNVASNELYTARFDDFIDNINDRPILLDHILLSPALSNRYANARIAHTEYNDQEDTTRPADDRDRFPSDHRPIVVEIN